jgi:hypothetical protein
MHDTDSSPWRREQLERKRGDDDPKRRDELFEQLPQEYFYFSPRHIERPAAGGGGAIEPAAFASQANYPRAQQAAVFEAMKHGIESASTKLVPMALQLFDHSQSKNRFFVCVIEDMNANQTGKEVLISNVFNFRRLHYEYRKLISKSDRKLTLLRNMSSPEKNNPPAAAVTGKIGRTTWLETNRSAR